jgi:hypothetical protein
MNLACQAFPFALFSDIQWLFLKHAHVSLFWANGSWTLHNKRPTNPSSCFPNLKSKSLRNVCLNMRPISRAQFAAVSILTNVVVLMPTSTFAQSWCDSFGLGSPCADPGGIYCCNNTHFIACSTPPEVSYGSTFIYQCNPGLFCVDTGYDQDGVHKIQCETSKGYLRQGEGRGQ